MYSNDAFVGMFRRRLEEALVQENGRIEAMQQDFRARIEPLQKIASVLEDVRNATLAIGGHRAFTYEISPLPNGDAPHLSIKLDSGPEWMVTKTNTFGPKNLQLGGFVTPGGYNETYDVQTVTQMLIQELGKFEAVRYALHQQAQPLVKDLESFSQSLGSKASLILSEKFICRNGTNAERIGEQMAIRVALTLSVKNDPAEYNEVVDMAAILVTDHDFHLVDITTKRGFYFEPPRLAKPNPHRVVKYAFGDFMDFLSAWLDAAVQRGVIESPETYHAV